MSLRECENVTKLLDDWTEHLNLSRRRLVLVMEFCAYDLRSILINHRIPPFTLDVIKGFAAQLFDGIDFIHEKNVIRPKIDRLYSTFNGVLSLFLRRFCTAISRQRTFC